MAEAGGLQPEEPKKKRSGCLITVNYALARLGAAVAVGLLALRAGLPAWPALGLLAAAFMLPVLARHR